MLQLTDILWLAGTALGGVVMVLVVRWRRRNFSVNAGVLADQEICEHLRPALELLLASGKRVTRTGQNHPDLPLEIHVAPPFDPQGTYDTLKLAPPVFVSERNVLYCKDDWCEIHPKP